MEYKLKKSQLAIMVFIITTCFKFAMLPSYISAIAKTQGYLTVLIYMLMDFLIFGAVYYVMINGGLKKIGLPKWLLNCIYIILFFYFIIKIILYLTESISYISMFLFDIGQWRFVTILGLIVLGYIALKGLRTIARLSDIFIWVIAVTTIFDIVFANADIDFTKILPFLPDGIYPVLKAGTENHLWFGNLIIFLFIDLKEEKGKGYWILISLVISLVLTVMYYVVFYGIYGNLAEEIPNVFNKFASLNTVSEDFGNFQWPTIIAWLVTSGLSISVFIFFAGTCINETIMLDKHAGFGKFIVIGIVLVVCFFFVTDIDKVYEFAKSWIKYYSVIVSYLVPIVVASILLIKKLRNSKNVCKAYQK